MQWEFLGTLQNHKRPWCFINVDMRFRNDFFQKIGRAYLLLFCSVYTFFAVNNMSFNVLIQMQIAWWITDKGYWRNFYHDVRKVTCTLAIWSCVVIEKVMWPSEIVQ